MTKEIKTLQQLNDFAMDLSHKLSCPELPKNLTLKIDLDRDEFNKLANEIASPHSVRSEWIDYFTYQFMGIKFFVYQKAIGE